MTDKLAFDVGLQEDATGAGVEGVGCDGHRLGRELVYEGPQNYGVGMGMLWG